MSESRTQRHGLEPFLSSPLAEAGGGDCVKIDIRSDLGHINLRGSPSDPQFLAIVGRVLRQDLPIAANTMTMGDHRVYWLGPDEWQIVTAIDDSAGLVKHLREALVGLQKRFYPGPDPEEYFMPSMGGSNATYRDAPWWLRTEDFINIESATDDDETVEVSEV